MCSAQTLIPIPEWATWNWDNFDVTHPEYGLDSQGRKCFQIDSCIVPALLAVWEAGFKTLGCCCGHGQGRGVISLDLAFDPTYENMVATHHCSFCGEVHVYREKAGE